jgi:hypothetical protein
LRSTRNLKFRGVSVSKCVWCGMYLSAYMYVCEEGGNWEKEMCLFCSCVFQTLLRVRWNWTSLVTESQPGRSSNTSVSELPLYRLFFNSVSPLFPRLPGTYIFVCFSNN